MCCIYAANRVALGLARGHAETALPLCPASTPGTEAPRHAVAPLPGRCGVLLVTCLPLADRHGVKIWWFASGQHPFGRG